MPSVGSGSERACPNASSKTSWRNHNRAASRQSISQQQSEEAGRISSKQHQAATRTASRRQVAAGGQEAGSKQPRLLPWVEGVSTATTLCCSFLLPSVEETARRSLFSKPPPAASVLSLQVCQSACQTKRRSVNLRNTSQTGPPTHYV